MTKSLFRKTTSAPGLLRIVRGCFDKIPRDVAGRARWRIENETFNTLKNQGYGFEHNFGHGKQHLATVFAQLAMLAFLIDQVQQRFCPLFRAAQEKEGRSKYLWERLRGLFLEFFIPDREVLYRAIAFGHHRTELVPFNTS